MSRAAEALWWGSALAALAAAGLIAWRVLSPQPVPVAPPAVYSPVAKAVPRSGQVVETERPANGFLLMVESTPDGANLFVDGEEKGPTPASLNFDCKEGQQLLLTLVLTGYAGIEHTVTCKKDVMLLLNAKLKKGR